MIPFTEIFSSFSVNDIKKAKNFYEDTVGIPVNETPQGLLLQIAVDHFAFVYLSPTHQPATFTVLNFRVDDVERTVDRLTATGVKFLQYDGNAKTNEKGIKRTPNGPVVAWFTDPAGNILSIMEPMSK
jgi:predicted enzyme related to lactoylglutathione lyase